MNLLLKKDQKIFVMHKIASVGRVVYAANLSLQLLWVLEVDVQWPLLDVESLWLDLTQVCFVVEFSVIILKRTP